MNEASLPDVEPARFDVPVMDTHDTGPEPARQTPPPAAPAPEARRGSRKRRRTQASPALKVLRRVWIPVVILAVFGAGGFTVWRLHGIFGTDTSVSYADTKQEQTKPFNPKQLRYEVFGAPGTVAIISYFDANGDPVRAEDVSLPWSLEFPITTAAGIGSIAVQGDSDEIGCRILVDNEVKAEKITSNQVSAFASCLLKAA